MAGGGVGMYRREGGKTGPVCQFVYVSQQCRGCWGGKVLVFFVKTGKAAEGAKKRRRRIWWVGLGAGRRGRRKSTNSRAFLGTYLPSCQLQPT